MLLHTIRSENALREALSSEYSEDPLLGAPPLDVELLTVNPYSRPGTPLEEVKNVAIHYTANPGSTAMNNRDYFEGLKDNHSNEVSSHFVIGLEGEIVQCIPTNEISYATNSRNVDTISIECCHPDETGQFNEATYQSLVELTAYLCNRFGLDIDHVIRHYDVTGKKLSQVLCGTSGRLGTIEVRHSDKNAGKTKRDGIKADFRACQKEKCIVL